MKDLAKLRANSILRSSFTNNPGFLIPDKPEAEPTRPVANA